MTAASTVPGHRLYATLLTTKTETEKPTGKTRGRDRSVRKEGRSQVGIAEENETIRVTENRLISLRFYFYFC